MAAQTTMHLKISSFSVFLLLSLSSLGGESMSYLSKGSTLSVEDGKDVLTSPDNTFTCGFYSVYGLNAYWFSVWYTTNSTKRTVVWMANRDKPVNGHGSSLKLEHDGTMVLNDFEGAIVWQSNTTSTNVDRAELLDSGNLVIKDPNGNFLWQSFDYPTNTLLPNQRFNKDSMLISGMGRDMFSSGYYSMFFDSNNVLNLLYDGPEMSSLYWPDPGDQNIYQAGRNNYNRSRIAVLDDWGRFLSSDRLQLSASDYGPGIKRRLTLDYDGNLRIYSLNESSGLWVITMEALEPCKVHGLCGKNGICTYNPEPKCSCPPSYEPTSATEWSKGCKPEFDRGSSDSQFVELPHTDYFGFDLNYTQPASLETCKDLCLGDYRCQSFSYRLDGQGHCWTKGDLFNGYRDPSFEGNIFLRLPTEVPANLSVSELACKSGEPSTILFHRLYYIASQGSTWKYLYLLASVIGAIEILILIIGWWFLYRKQGLPGLIEDGYRAISSQFRCFTYAELKRATGKFKEVLGIGGFGAVYKGVLEDARVVAVKRLGDVLMQGEEEFWAEVSTIGKINHINLVRMWGYCLEGKHRLLVYEYVQNGSLDKHLFSGSSLGWKERFKIAVGTAKGLAYLHHECLEWVIHCDVKPENILLDCDFEPKISDFGLAKLCQRGGNGSEFSRIRGTKGYMAPEWAMNLPITAKVDVYSYGVMILELVKGIRLSNRTVDDGESELNRFVRITRRKIKNGEDSWVEDTIDPRLEGQFSRNQAATMIEIGLSCVEEDRNRRPTMESVAQMLLECEDVSVLCTPQRF
ncbi:hypothetical protein Ancab_001793 [Ancistrocladus abbreviatus]